MAIQASNEVSLFKTGDIIMLGNGVVVEILNDSYNLPFILVQRIDTEPYRYRGYTLNQNIVVRNNFKHLGRNLKAAQVLLGKSIRGAYV